MRSGLGIYIKTHIHKSLIDYGRPESSLIHGLTTPTWTGSGWLGLCQTFQDLLEIEDLC